MGRAYQYIFFDAPFRAILWDEALMLPVVEGLFNTTWNAYVTNVEVDKWIQRSIVINGILYVIAAIAALAVNSKNRRYLKFPILVGAWLLVLLFVLSMKEQFFQFPQFFEHAIQFGVPFVLLLAIKGTSLKRISFYLKILIALTFTGHGLYALGIYPMPGHFIDMTILSLGVTQSTAVLVLKTVGILDLLLSVLIFVPKWANYFLLYAFVWGILTALARIVSIINLEFMMNSMHQFLYQVVYRLPHGLIPLLVFLIHRHPVKNLKELKNISPLNNSSI